MCPCFKSYDVYMCKQYGSVGSRSRQWNGMDIGIVRRRASTDASDSRDRVNVDHTSGF